MKNIFLIEDSTKIDEKTKEKFTIIPLANQFLINDLSLKTENLICIEISCYELIDNYEELLEKKYNIFNVLQLLAKKKGVNKKIVFFIVNFNKSKHNFIINYYNSLLKTIQVELNYTIEFLFIITEKNFIESKTTDLIEDISLMNFRSLTNNCFFV